VTGNDRFPRFGKNEQKPSKIISRHPIMIPLPLRTSIQRLASRTQFIHYSRVGPTYGLRGYANTPRRPPVIKRIESNVVSSTQEKVPKSMSAAILPLAIVPMMFIMYGVSEHFLTDRQLRLNEELRQQFEAEHGEGIRDEGSRQFLFYCVIRRTRGLTHSLSNIQVGDVVEVLEEGVGPNNEYNLCRFPAPPGQPHVLDTVGWFPIRWLQKLEDYEQMAQRSERMAGRLKD
jgi:hypothetical protein